MDSQADYHEYCTGGYDKDDIVISGIAGRFPSSDNIGEFKENLYNKKDLKIYDDSRYKKGAMKVPYDSCGLINGLEQFDADFFCCGYSIAHGMDPATRIHMAVTFEALADAGYDATNLKGLQIGVYNGTTHDDAQKIRSRGTQNVNLNCVRTMHPNRTSFSFDWHGPSYVVDAACSSSSIAFYSAVNDIRHGVVEAAVVSGCQLNLCPSLTIGYIRAGILSVTGNSKPFDASSDGMMRTEAVTCIFLQKASTARRAYAKVSAVNFYTAGFVPEGISVPSYPMQKIIMQKTLEDANVQLDEIDYVECHGTGTKVGDPLELNAVASTFCQNRNRPLLVGSVKSNIGHTEAAAGICSLIKSIFAFEEGKIPPHINYENPNPDSPALVEGKLLVVTEPTPFTKDHIPITSLGFGGTLVQMLLKKNPISMKDRPQTVPDLPRLILYPGTTEEAIETVFDYVQKHPDLPNEFYALLNPLAFTQPLRKPIRGYALYQDWNKPVKQIKSLTTISKRPVWFVMTGMGCQWPGMGLQLMKIDVFAESMKKSAAVLKKFNIDLFEFLRADKNYLTEQGIIIPPFVTICSIQIALVDLLHHLGIHPDGIIGHSVGELICSYADGCTTAEQTLLAAYYRGLSVEQSDLPPGGMAAVGMSFEEVKKICPEGMYAACDNSEDSVTVSGRKGIIEKFVKKLEDDKIFVRMVNAHGFAFHCTLVHNAAILLRENMRKVITDPKPRTQRWVSTSYPEEEWDNPSCRNATAEYFVHNLLSSVLFRSGLKRIPSDAILIEIGPHFLLQSILKRAIGSQASYFGMMKRNDTDNVKFFLDTLGKMYNEGLDPRIEKLYPPVKFPVPRGLPQISDLIRWNHSIAFDVPKYTSITSEFSHKFEMDNEDDTYLLDHRIDGKSLFPATGYICLAWEALASKMHKNIDELPIVVENFKIHRAILLNPKTQIKFLVNILDSNGLFEITDGKSIVASGEIFEFKNVAFEEGPPSYTRNERFAVSGKDVYNELKMAGYEYGPEFQGMKEMNIEGTSGIVEWHKKWIPFLDSLLLFFGLVTERKGFCLPTGAKSFKIDPSVIKEMCSSQQEKDDVVLALPVTYNPNTHICRSVGVEISSLQTDPAPLKGNPESPVLEQYKFIPYNSTFSPSQDTNECIAKYFQACNEAMGRVSKVLGNDCHKYQFTVKGERELDIEDLQDDGRGNRCLLMALDQISCSHSTKLKDRQEVFSSYMQSIGKDILNSTLLNDESLRILLETITENSYRKLNAAEINRNFPLVLPILSDMLQKYFYTKFKKSVVVEEKPVESKEDQEILEENNIQLLKRDNLNALKDLDLIISSFTNGKFADLQDHIHTLKSAVKSDGYIMFIFKSSLNSAEQFLSSSCSGKIEVQSQQVLEKILQEKNLLVLSRISDPFGGLLYLLRSSASDKGTHKILQVKEGSYAWVTDLRKEFSENSSSTIWLVAQDTIFNGIVGLVNCLKQEPGGERIRCVFISQKKNEATLPHFSLDHSFYKQLPAKNLVMNIWKEGEWGSYKHVLIQKAKSLKLVEHSCVHCRKYGDLSSLEWIESNIKYSDIKNRKLVHIYYSALNFKDVMLATGKISTGTGKVVEDGSCESVLGLEYSGRDPSGQRVCGLTASCGLATSILSNPAFHFEVPENWTLEEAATIPVVYTTCYYALIMRAKLQRGESVLIHSGTGGIGMAAINIATSLECEIFTTVGNEEKRKYLREKFPHIKEENIGCSRDTSFLNMVLKRTKGNGVDVVLNSLADDKFQAGLRCVATNGRFVEIGKYDLSLDRQMGLKLFLENISFHAVFLDILFATDKKSLSILADAFSLMREGIKTGVVKPLQRTVYARECVEDAFRYMAKGVHVGKVLLKIRDEELQKHVVPKTLMLPAVPNTYFRSHKVYIIIGGLGGFGIELTKWIISRGGRNIILTSRYGARTPYHFLCLNRWKHDGANVQVSTLNACKKNEAEKLLQDASRLGPVGGIINSAVVLKDAFMDCQTPEDYREVCAPKATATRNLDELSRKLCPSLDLFICFSSISCGRGNAGQTNYGYANSVMERICEDRRSAGLHGLAIQWGIIGEVGVVHRNMGDDAMIAGIKAQSAKSCLGMLDAFCQQESPVVTSYMAVTASKQKVQLNITTQIAKILGLDDVSQLSTVRTFGEMGIDSMIGVELKQFIESSSDVTVTFQEIQSMKIGDLTETLQSEEQMTTQASATVSTAVVKIPPILRHNDPVVVLNKENDSSGDPIFIVNIGNHDVTNFTALAKALKRSVSALVWTKNTPVNDVGAIASWYLQAIRTVTKGAFHLIGHSLGGNVALEMAIQSQKIHGSLKSIHLLNGSQDLVVSLSKDNAENIDPEAAALCRFVEQFTDHVPQGLEDEVLKLENTEQRVKAVIDRLTLASNEKKDVEDAITGYLQRFEVVHPYIPSEKLRMDLQLLEDPMKVLPNDITTLKVLLKQVCSGKITVQRAFSFVQMSNKDEAQKLASSLPGII